MPGTRRHDPGIAQEMSVAIFERPSAKSVLLEGSHVSIELRVAFGAAQGAAEIARDFGESVQRGKFNSVTVHASSKREPFRRISIRLLLFRH